MCIFKMPTLPEIKTTVILPFTPVVLIHLGPAPIYLCPFSCLGWPIWRSENKCVLSNWLPPRREHAHPLHCGINTREPHNVQAFLAH